MASWAISSLFIFLVIPRSTIRSWLALSKIVLNFLKPFESWIIIVKFYKMQIFEITTSNHWENSSSLIAPLPSTSAPAKAEKLLARKWKYFWKIANSLGLITISKVQNFALHLIQGVLSISAWRRCICSPISEASTKLILPSWFRSISTSFGPYPELNLLFNRYRRKRSNVNASIFDSALSHTCRSDASEKKRRKKRVHFWTFSPVDKFRVLACIG